MIPLCEPTLGSREMSYLRECITDGWVSAEGPFVSRFEQALARRHGKEFHAACTSSGTTALQLALMASGLAPGDLVIVPAMSFLATLNPVVHCGAEPLVMDIEAQTLGLDPARLREWLPGATLKRNGRCYDRLTGRRLFGVIAVHLYGIPCAIREIREICQEYGLELIEDNAESLGALSSDQPTGTFGRASILSFNGNKAITAGGGGMVLSSDEELVSRVRNWANHARECNGDDPGEYGFNYRISNLQAAVGLAQVERMDELIGARQHHHEAYRKAFRAAGLHMVEGRESDKPTWWLHVLRSAGELSAEELMERLGSDGIQGRRLFKPFNQVALYERFARDECPVAAAQYERAIALPSSAHLTPEDREIVIQKVVVAAMQGSLQRERVS